MDCAIMNCTGCKKPMITLKGSNAQLEDVEYNVTEQWCKECSIDELAIKRKALSHFSWAFKRFMDGGDCWEDAFGKAVDEVMGGKAKSKEKYMTYCYDCNKDVEVDVPIHSPVICDDCAKKDNGE